MTSIRRKPYMRLTPAGRRLARSWTGQRAYKPPPAGTLREWHWRALALAYAAGEAGLAGEYGEYGGIGWPTRRRLLDYKVGVLVTEGGLKPPYDHRLRITAAGCALYEREAARYRTLYPNIEAPVPAPEACA